MVPFRVGRHCAHCVSNHETGAYSRMCWRPPLVGWGAHTSHAQAPYHRTLHTLQNRMPQALPPPSALSEIRGAYVPN